MAFIPYGHSPGPLWDAGTKLRELAYRFWDMANYCKEKAWLIGPLATPLFALGDGIRSGGDKLQDADQWLDNVSREIQALGTIEGILNIITNVWPWFDDFLWNPADHVRYWIGNQIGLSPYEMQNWEFMVKAIVQRYLTTLYPFYIDPHGEVIRRVAEHSSFLAGLVTDPGRQIREWFVETLSIPYHFRDHPGNWPHLLLEQAWPNYYFFRDDPTRYIKDLLYDWNPDLKYLFDHPIEWVKALVAEAAGYPYTFWDDVPGSLWNTLSDYLERTLEDKSEWLESMGARLLIHLW